LSWPTPYFSRDEFRCPCCTFDTIDYELVNACHEIRQHFKSPVQINSACRCSATNESVGGSKNSQHLYGRAADIVVVGVESSKVADFAETLSLGGIGRYPTFTHIDTRQGRARW
jgi:uncharacterized protein YcbK (DUF882 family)